MADIHLVNNGMINAKADIDQYSAELKTAGESFINALNLAISEMEGDSKDKLYAYFNSASVKTFLEENLPELISSFGTLLETNRTTFIETDSSFASQVPEG